jgi:hypothetical protein
MALKLIEEKLRGFSPYIFYGLLDHANGRMQCRRQFKIIEPKQSKT